MYTCLVSKEGGQFYSSTSVLYSAQASELFLHTYPVLIYWKMWRVGVNLMWRCSTIICFSLIYDYIIIYNLAVSAENNFKIDIPSAHLTGTETGKVLGISLCCGFYSYIHSMFNSEGPIQSFGLEYLQSLVPTFPTALPIRRKSLNCFWGGINCIQKMLFVTVTGT